jgi:hypothetical protein
MHKKVVNGMVKENRSDARIKNSKVHACKFYNIRSRILIFSLAQFFKMRAKNSREDFSKKRAE